jgi:anti-sigma factor RsiW
MSLAPDKVTEADLVAYVDGKLAPAERAAVEGHLADHPRLAEEVAAWRDQNAAIVALHGSAGDEPVPARLDPRAIERNVARDRGRWRRMAAAAVVLLAVGGAGGWFGRDLAGPSTSAAAPLIDEALVAHRIYVGETVHAVEVAADQRDHLATWLSKRLDRPLVVPDLRAQAFDLVGGRLLPAAAGPAAQFMYEDADGQRITLYILPASAGAESAFRWAGFDRLGAFYWTDGRISCAIIGDLPRAELRAIAEQAYEQLG